MKKYIFLSVLVSSFLLTKQAIANQDIVGSSNFYLAVKGGVSLGSYEAGINWVLLQSISDGRLKSVSGASAGSLNSILSAIEHCGQNNSGPQGLIDNVLRTSWDIGVPEMLQHEKDNREVSLLTRLPIKKHVETQVRKQLSNGKPDCSFVMTMSVTMMEPLKVELPSSKQSISLQRFVVPIEVRVNDYHEFKFYNFPRDDARMRATDKGYIPGPYLKLAQKTPGDKSEEVSFDSVLALSYASSAFPVAFEPIQLNYCIENELKPGELCTGSQSYVARFSDGGLFDNSPVGVATDILLRELSKRSSNNEKLVFINPDNYRYFNKIPKRKRTTAAQELIAPLPGLSKYAEYLLTSFETATAENYKEALLFFEESNEHRLFISTRHHNLFADFHAHFGALYSPDFRMHDYLVGVYDGQYLLSQLACSKNKKEKLESCVELKMDAWVNGLSGKFLETAPKQTLKPHIDFLKYLYNSEFKQNQAKENDNIFITFAQSFPSPSRITSQETGLAFDDYISSLAKNLTPAQKETLAPETEQVVYKYRLWAQENLEQTLENLIEMQRLTGSDDKLDQAIGDAISLTTPIYKSYFDYYSGGTWIHPYGWQSNSYAFRYGFDTNEKSQELELAARFWTPLLVSVDLTAGFNVFGGELASDNYWDTSISLTGHTNWKGIINTVGIGYEYSYEGAKVYKDDLQAIRISVGTLNEFLHFKYSRRISGFDSGYPKQTREDSTFAIMFDITKLTKFVINSL